MSIFDFSVIVFVLQTKPRQTDCTAAPSMSFIRVLARLVQFFAPDLTANMCGRCNLDGVSGRWQPGSNCNAEHFSRSTIVTNIRAVSSPRHTPKTWHDTVDNHEHART